MNYAPKREFWKIEDLWDLEATAGPCYGCDDHLEVSTTKT
jgi:hypothetical protein